MIMTDNNNNKKKNKNNNDRAIARVNAINLINVEQHQVAASPQSSQTDIRCGRNSCVLFCKIIPFVILMIYIYYAWYAVDGFINYSYVFLLQHGSAKEQSLNASKVCYFSLFKTIDSLSFCCWLQFVSLKHVAG